MLIFFTNNQFIIIFTYRNQTERGCDNVTDKRRRNMTGLQQSNVARVEQGRYNVGLDILQSIADALNADVKIVQRK